MISKLFASLWLIATAMASGQQNPGEIRATDYASIPAALAANPHRMVFVPAGDHVITEKIRLRGERSGLHGPGRIIQQNPDQPILEIENAGGVEIREITLTRPEGRTETHSEAIRAQNCRDLVIENVKVINNRTNSGAILVTDSTGTRISRCLVRNYMRVSVDDRTKGETSGYAFRCTDGTGIMVRYSKDTLIEGNRVIEETYFPTKACRDQFITANQFIRNDLWAIGLMPGAAAHPAQEGKAANADGGSIIANNLISAFGHGDARWIWGEERSPFKFDSAQEPDDPPLTDVLIQGNLVDNSGPPRYIYAVIISNEPTGPKGLHFSGNLFPPGTRGICNQEMKP